MALFQISRYREKALFFFVGESCRNFCLLLCRTAVVSGQRGYETLPAQTSMLMLHSFNSSSPSLSKQTDCSLVLGTILFIVKFRAGCLSPRRDCSTEGVEHPIPAWVRTYLLLLYIPGTHLTALRTFDANSARLSSYVLSVVIWDHRAFVCRRVYVERERCNGKNAHNTTYRSHDLTQADVSSWY